MEPEAGFKGCPEPAGRNRPADARDFFEKTGKDAARKRERGGGPAEHGIATGPLPSRGEQFAGVSGCPGEFEPGADIADSGPVRSPHHPPRTRPANG